MSTEQNDPRECGWMGCGHFRCATGCDAVTLPEWREWKRGEDKIKAAGLWEAADDLARFRAFPWCVRWLRRRAEELADDTGGGEFDLQDTRSDKPL